MIHCAECGYLSEDDARFCGYCSHSFIAEEEEVISLGPRPRYLPSGKEMPWDFSDDTRKFIISTQKFWKSYYLAPGYSWITDRDSALQIEGYNNTVYFANDLNMAVKIEEV